MAKSRKSSGTRRAAAPRRAPTRRVGTTTAARSKRRSDIALKPLYEHVSRTVLVLRKAQPNVRVRLALRRLERWAKEFDEICGPNMAIPGGDPSV